MVSCNESISYGRKYLCRTCGALLFEYVEHNRGCSPPPPPSVLLFVIFCVFFLSLQVTLVTNVQLDSPWICPVHTVGVSCFSISLEISIKIEFFLLHIWV